MSEDSLYVEWEGIYHPNLTYYVYRSNNPILSRPLLTTATVIGSVKATNNSSSYSMLDILPTYGIYYYAVISYVDNIGFYTADSDVDTVSFEYRENNRINTITNTITNTVTIGNNNNTNAYTLILIANEETNTNTTNNILNDNNTIKDQNTNETNYNHIYTNYIYTNIANTNENTDGIVNTNSIQTTIDNIMETEIPPAPQTEYDMYMNEYNKALAQFRLGNYSTVITLLEPVSTKNVNRNLYYNINLLLGKAYKNTSQKQNALNVFRRIQSINSTEVNFWVNQVLSDL